MATGKIHNENRPINTSFSVFIFLSLLFLAIKPLYIKLPKKIIAKPNPAYSPVHLVQMI